MTSDSMADAGFSLVETLIATFLLAIVSAASVALLTGHQNTGLALRDANGKLAGLEVTRVVMRNDFFAAIERPLRDEFGDLLPAFEGGPHLLDGVHLRLARDGHMGAKLSGTASQLKRVDYRVQDDALVRRTYARTDQTPEAIFQDQTLLTGIETFSLRFAAEGIWVDEWGTGANITELPRLAEARFVFDSGRTASMTFLIGSGP